MTTVFEETIICAVCGDKSQYMSIGSTNTFGSMDLDTRPPEMQRSTIDMWMKVCSSCGYCSTDLSKCHKQSPEIVRSPVYRQQLKNPRFPELANTFLCSSLIKETTGQYAVAGWDCIHAAWACDDSGSESSAKECREKAIVLLHKAKEKGQRFAAQDGASKALMVDLLRRSEKFETALEICNDSLDNDKTEDIIRKILNFQKALIQKGDIACHTIPE